MTMPWGALLGAGASLVGSIFGGKQKNTTTTSHVDYKRLVREAEAAGFNPLTALRNGGAAGFSVTTSSGGGAPLSSRIADGVAGAMNVLSQSDSFLSKFDPHADNLREAQYSLINAQVANLEASTAAMMRQASNYEHRPSGGAAQLSKQGAALSALGLPQTPEAGDVTVTNPHAHAVVDPNQRDADAYTVRYGEPGEYAGAYLAAEADLRHNIRHRPRVVHRGANYLMRLMTPSAVPAFLSSAFGPEGVAFEKPFWDAIERGKQKAKKEAAKLRTKRLTRAEAAARFGR